MSELAIAFSCELDSSCFVSVSISNCSIRSTTAVVTSGSFSRASEARVAIQFLDLDIIKFPLKHLGVSQFSALVYDVQSMQGNHQFGLSNSPQFPMAPQSRRNASFRPILERDSGFFADLTLGWNNSQENNDLELLFCRF